MKIACFFLLTIGAMAEPLERKGSHYFIRHVFVEGHGPFRFLLDTGAEASAVSEDVAARLGIAAEYRVEQVTASGVRITPVGHTRLRVGSSEIRGAEVLIGGFAAAADGVLGQSFLRHTDYLVTREAIELDAAPIGGTRLPLRMIDGRPAVAAHVDGVARNLVLDSGAPALVLFGPRQGREVQLVSTNTGSTYGSRETVRVNAGGIHRVLDAVWLPGQGVGLLPVTAFRSVYVSNSRSYVVLR